MQERVAAGGRGGLHGIDGMGKTVLFGAGWMRGESPRLCARLPSAICRRRAEGDAARGRPRGHDGLPAASEAVRTPAQNAVESCAVAVLAQPFPHSGDSPAILGDSGEPKEAM